MPKDEFEEYNFYKVLSISDTATNKEIDEAYKRFAITYHSDKTGWDDLPMKIANNARDVLKNPISRAAHNNFIHSKFTQSYNNNVKESQIISLKNSIVKLKRELIESANISKNLKQEIYGKLRRISELEREIEKLNLFSKGKDKEIQVWKNKVGYYIEEMKIIKSKNEASEKSKNEKIEDNNKILNSEILNLRYKNAENESIIEFNFKNISELKNEIITKNNDNKLLIKMIADIKTRNFKIYAIISGLFVFIIIIILLNINKF